MSRQPMGLRPCCAGRLRAALAVAVALALAACAGGPPPPDWQLKAHGALDRAVAAYLAGDTRTADAEFEPTARRACVGGPVRATAAASPSISKESLRSCTRTFNRRPPICGNCW